jgi:O-antigen/teichoic acid export membrane protein
LSLRNNFSWTFAGNTFYAACQWGILVAITKLGKPEMVGQFVLGLAVTTPIIMFTNMQLRGVQATDAKQDYSFSDYLGFRIVATIIAIIIIILVLIKVQYPRETTLVILLIGIAKSFESISDVFFGLIQQHERMDRIAISLFLKGIFSLIAFTILLHVSNHIIWPIVGLIFAWAFVLFSYDIKSGFVILRKQHELKPSWHWKVFRDLIWLCLPLGFVRMLISLNENIPRYFIEHFLGIHELGIYSALAYLIVAGSMIINALGASATPRLAKYYSAGEKTAFLQLTIKLVGLAALIGLSGLAITTVVGKQILTLLYEPEYSEYVNVLKWLMIAGSFNYVASFLGYSITAARFFRIQVFLFSTTTIISAILCFILLPVLGLEGAAIALFMSSLIQVALSSGIVYHAIRKIPTSEYKSLSHR